MLGILRGELQKWVSTKEILAGPLLRASYVRENTPRRRESEAGTIVNEST